MPSAQVQLYGFAAFLMYQLAAITSLREARSILSIGSSAQSRTDFSVESWTLSALPIACTVDYELAMAPRLTMIGWRQRSKYEPIFFYGTLSALQLIYTGLFKDLQLLLSHHR